MILTIKRCAVTPAGATINGSDSTIFPGKYRLPMQRSLLALRPSSLAAEKKNPKPSVLCSSISKSLHNASDSSSSIGGSLASITKPQNPNNKSSLIAKCKFEKAYEAEQWQPIHPKIEENAAAKRVLMAIYVAAWWGSSVLFNRYNKKVLNVFPYPWLTSTFSLAFPSLMFLISWGNNTLQPPTKTDFQFWKTLFPVALAHTIGHVAVNVSMSKAAVSFTHIIKGYEPAVSVLVSRFLLGETFPLPVYNFLFLIASGCTLAAVTDLNFNMTGFMGAMISNLAFVFRNIFSKKGMKEKSMSGINYYYCLCVLSLLILMPFAVAVEGPQLWAAGLQTFLSKDGPHFVWWMVGQSIFYHYYNKVSYIVLDETSPLTVSIGNTMKRISVIFSSIIIFWTPVQPINLLGGAIACVGLSKYMQHQRAEVRRTSSFNLHYKKEH